MEAERLRLQEDLGRRSRITLRVLDKTFKELDAECFETFRGLALDDDAGRLNCTLMVNALEQLKDKLVSATIAGENARKALIKTTVKDKETHVRNPT